MFILNRLFTNDGVTPHPGRVMIFAFLFVIAIGTYLLMMPWATVAGEISFIDALFTSTSAVCVVGLVVVDTGLTFTHSGHVLLLVLIELGGLGIMTFSTFFILSLGKKLSFKDRPFLKENVGYLSNTNLLHLLVTMVFVILFIQLIGAILYFIRFSTLMSFEDSIFYSIFYSISAFCAAGFTLFSDSLVQYRNDTFMNFTTIGLVLMGGFGFFVIEDLLIKIKALIRRQKMPPFSFQSKVIFVTTVWSIVIGTALFYLLERENVLAGMSFKESALTSLFQIISVRHAGMSTINWAEITNGTGLISIILMFIGGAPGSCVGGIKVTTFFVLTLLVISRMQGKTTVSAFKRNISANTVTKSISIFAAAFLFSLIMCILLEITETQGVLTLEARAQFIPIFFEVVSAFGTVGMSMGITPSLTFLGKWVIIITMFVGRIGPLALALTIIPEEKKALYSYPSESVLTG